MKDYSPLAGHWRFRAAAAGTLLVAAVAAAALALGDRVPPLDAWIAQHLYSRPGTVPAEIATAISGAATFAGFALLVAASVSLVRRHRARGVKLLMRFGAVLALGLTPLALQAVFQRSGPPVTAQDWTYPSGHVVVLTALAFTAFAITSYLAPAWRRALAVSAVAALLVVGASRVTLGEHYLVDVVAALLATAGVGLVAMAVLGLRLRLARPAGATA